jgi:NAD(P)-dependent dehydrogenase (short-subunit alcohol dehydrogenase family)
MYDLYNKVAVVTGAAGKRGLGRAIANRLAREGADVAVIDKFMIPPRDEDMSGGWAGLNSVVEEMQKTGRKAMAVTCAISSSKEVDEMVKKVIDRFGYIDILVNNASVHLFTGGDEDWNKSLSINLSGTYYCMRSAAAEMIKRSQGGKIINIASTQGKLGRGNGDIGYCASKFGVVGITQDFAMQVARHHINVNAVCPGMAPTDIGSEHHKAQAAAEGITPLEAREREFKRRLASIPLGRLTSPEDIAAMVAFLASKEADYITGQSINVNGGSFTAH